VLIVCVSFHFYSNLISSLFLLCSHTDWKVTIASDNCDVVQVILLLFGMEFLWRKSGELIENHGYGPEYEVIQSLCFTDLASF